MLRNLYRIQLLRNANSCLCTQRYRSSEAPQMTDGEKKLVDVLKNKFPKAEEVQVQDISGGCGAMYEILISSVEFSGKRTVMQHRMVNEALKEEIKDMHGLRVSTKVPD